MLQHQDLALDKIQAAMDKIPVEIAAVRAALEREKTSASEIKTEILNFEKKKKERELEVGQKEEDARKHSGQLNQVKTNEAFRALQGEIDRAKKEAGELETQILEIMESLDASRREEKGILASLKLIEEKAKGEIAVHETKLKELQSQFESAKAARDASASPVPPDVMKVYNHIRSRGKKDAVVLVDGDLCSACRITLAPQVIIEATKAKALVTCESCQRILYRAETAAAAKVV